MAKDKQRDLIEAEQAEEKSKEAAEQKKASREVRSLELIAEFENGFAKDWLFPIPETFKNELDIKLTQRMEPVLDENGEPVMEKVKDKKGNTKLNKDGSPRLKQKSRPVLKWTQGRFYCFAEGHVIYDSPKAYEGEWKESVKHFKFRVEVVRATSNDLDSSNQFQDGWVTFTVSEPSKDEIRMNRLGQYNVTQTDFVEFLKHGRLKVNFDYLIDLIHSKTST
jgi:hypothetical protein